MCTARRKQEKQVVQTWPLSMHHQHPSHFSVFGFPVFFFPLNKGRGYKSLLQRPQGRATGPPLARHSLSDAPSMPPTAGLRPLAPDALVCHVPSNSSVLCLLTGQMYCPEVSGNAEVIHSGFLAPCAVHFHGCPLGTSDMAEEAEDRPGAWMASLGGGAPGPTSP